MIAEIQAFWRGKINDANFQNALERGELLNAIERAEQIIREARLRRQEHERTFNEHRKFLSGDMSDGNLAQEFIADVIRRDDERRRLMRLKDDLQDNT